MTSNSSIQLLDAAFRLLEPQLRALPHAPHDLAAFTERLINSKDHAASESTLAEASGKLLTIKEVAGRMNISIRSAQALVRGGILPRLKIGHRLVRVPESAISQMIKRADPIGQASVQSQPKKRS
jgi:excisionase family DNA binding protein